MALKCFRHSVEKNQFHMAVWTYMSDPQPQDAIDTTGIIPCSVLCQYFNPTISNLMSLVYGWCLVCVWPLTVLHRLLGERLDKIAKSFPVQQQQQQQHLLISTEFTCFRTWLTGDARWLGVSCTNVLYNDPSSFILDFWHTVVAIHVFWGGAPSGDEIFWRKRRMSSTLAGVVSGLENHSAKVNLVKRIGIIYLDYI